MEIITSRTSCIVKASAEELNAFADSIKAMALLSNRTMQIQSSPVGTTYYGHVEGSLTLQLTKETTDD